MAGAVRFRVALAIDPGDGWDLCRSPIPAFMGTDGRQAPNLGQTEREQIMSMKEIRASLDISTAFQMMALAAEIINDRLQKNAKLAVSTPRSWPIPISADEFFHECISMAVYYRGQALGEASMIDDEEKDEKGRPSV